MFVKLRNCLLENVAGIGIVLGFLLWRNRIYETYFGPPHRDTVRPAAGILLFAFALNFVAIIGLTFFRLVRMTLRTNPFTKRLFEGRLLPKLIGISIQLLVGLWLAACIIDSWKRLTQASGCLPARSCQNFPFSWLLEGKFLVCSKLDRVGGTFYPELICEGIFDLTPFFLVLTLTAATTVVISILQTRTRQGYVAWKKVQQGSSVSHEKVQ